MSEKRKSENAMAGMRRAMMHALDMNSNGRLEAKELDQFRRFIVGRAMDGMPMEHHIEAKKRGDIDFMREAAGYDDDEDPYDAEKSRKGVAGKIVADYLGKLWNEGHIDDQTYIAEMQNIGAAEVRDEDAADPKDIAAKVWQAANGAEEADEAEMASMESDAGMPTGESDQVDEEFLADFAKRNSKKER